MTNSTFQSTSFTGPTGPQGLGAIGPKGITGPTGATGPTGSVAPYLYNYKWPYSTDDERVQLTFYPDDKTLAIDSITGPNAYGSATAHAINLGNSGGELLKAVSSGDGVTFQFRGLTATNELELVISSTEIGISGPIGITSGYIDNGDTGEFLFLNPRYKGNGASGSFYGASSDNTGTGNTIEVKFRNAIETIGNEFNSEFCNTNIGSSGQGDSLKEYILDVNNIVKYRAGAGLRYGFLCITVNHYYEKDRIVILRTKVNNDEDTLKLREPLYGAERVNFEDPISGTILWLGGNDDTGEGYADGRSADDGGYRKGIDQFNTPYGRSAQGTEEGYDEGPHPQTWSNGEDGRPQEVYDCPTDEAIIFDTNCSRDGEISNQVFRTQQFCALTEENSPTWDFDENPDPNSYCLRIDETMFETQNINDPWYGKIRLVAMPACNTSGDISYSNYNFTIGCESECINDASSGIPCWKDPSDIGASSTSEGLTGRFQLDITNNNIVQLQAPIDITDIVWNYSQRPGISLDSDDGVDYSETKNVTLLINGGPDNIKFPDNVKFAGTPTFTNGLDIVNLLTIDNGKTWFATLTGYGWDVNVFNENDLGSCCSNLGCLDFVSKSYCDGITGEFNINTSCYNRTEEICGAGITGGCCTGVIDGSTTFGIYCDGSGDSEENCCGCDCLPDSGDFGELNSPILCFASFNTEFCPGAPLDSWVGCQNTPCCGGSSPYQDTPMCDGNATCGRPDCDEGQYDLHTTACCVARREDRDNELDPWEYTPVTDNTRENDCQTWRNATNMSCMECHDIRGRDTRSGAKRLPQGTDRHNEWIRLGGNPAGEQIFIDYPGGSGVCLDLNNPCVELGWCVIPNSERELQWNGGDNGSKPDHYDNNNSNPPKWDEWSLFDRTLENNWPEYPQYSWPTNPAPPPASEHISPTGVWWVRNTRQSLIAWGGHLSGGENCGGLEWPWNIPCSRCDHNKSVWCFETEAQALELATYLGLAFGVQGPDARPYHIKPPRDHPDIQSPIHHYCHTCSIQPDPIGTCCAPCPIGCSTTGEKETDCLQQGGRWHHPDESVSVPECDLCSDYYDNAGSVVTGVPKCIDNQTLLQCNLINGTFLPSGDPDREPCDPIGAYSSGCVYDPCSEAEYGSCCDTINGNCYGSSMREFQCASLGGPNSQWNKDGTCDDCCEDQVLRGACCICTDSCINQLTPQECSSLNGIFMGENTTCAGSNCTVAGSCNCECNSPGCCDCPSGHPSRSPCCDGGGPECCGPGDCCEPPCEDCFNLFDCPGGGGDDPYDDDDGTDNGNIRDTQNFSYKYAPIPTNLKIPSDPRSDYELGSCCDGFGCRHIFVSSRQDETFNPTPSAERQCYGDYSSGVICAVRSCGDKKHSGSCCCLTFSLNCPNNDQNDPQNGEGCEDCVVKDYVITCADCAFDGRIAGYTQPTNTSSDPYKPLPSGYRASDDLYNPPATGDKTRNPGQPFYTPQGNPIPYRWSDCCTSSGGCRSAPCTITERSNLRDKYGIDPNTVPPECPDFIGNGCIAAEPCSGTCASRTEYEDACGNCSCYAGSCCHGAAAGDDGTTKEELEFVSLMSGCPGCQACGAIACPACGDNCNEGIFSTCTFVYDKTKTTQGINPNSIQTTGNLCSDQAGDADGTKDVLPARSGTNKNGSGICNLRSQDIWGGSHIHDNGTDWNIPSPFSTSNVNSERVNINPNSGVKFRNINRRVALTTTILNSTTTFGYTQR